MPVCEVATAFRLTCGNLLGRAKHRLCMGAACQVSFLGIIRGSLPLCLLKKLRSRFIVNLTLWIGDNYLSFVRGRSLHSNKSRATNIKLAQSLCSSRWGSHFFVSRSRLAADVLIGVVE